MPLELAYCSSESHLLKKSSQYVDLTLMTLSIIIVPVAIGQAVVFIRSQKTGTQQAKDQHVFNSIQRTVWNSKNSLQCLLGTDVLVVMDSLLTQGAVSNKRYCVPKWYSYLETGGGQAGG